MTQSTRSRDEEVVITALGCLTSGGYGLDAHWRLIQDSDGGVDAGLAAAADKPGAERYSLRGFKAAPYLTDRRMLKAVSTTDAIGLAVVEGVKKDLNWAAAAPYAAERIGIYVGSPPASCFDNEFYMDAMDASRGPDGRCSVQAFGKTSMNAMPMTLLVGLPNNVLCYSAMIFDAKGPNSNYTATALSAHMALHNAARRVRRGTVDCALAGGFSTHTEAVNSRMYAGLVAVADGTRAIEPFAGEGTVLADGAAFVALERRAAATARGQAVIATYLGGALANDGLGPVMIDARGEALEGAVRRALAEAGLAPSDIGLVLANAAGDPSADLCEFSVLSRVYAKEREIPALGCSARLTGNLMEAGGLLEIGLAARMIAAGKVPKLLRPGGAVADSRFTTTIDRSKPYALILRASPWGEYSALVVRTAD